MKNCSSFRNGHCNVMMKPVRVGKTSTSLTPRTRFCTRQQGGGGQDTTWEWDQHWPVGQLRQDHAGLHGRAPDCQDQGSNVQEISTVAFAFSQYSLMSNGILLTVSVPNSAFLLQFLFRLAHVEEESLHKSQVFWQWRVFSSTLDCTTSRLPKKIRNKCYMWGGSRRSKCQSISTKN